MKKNAILAIVACGTAFLAATRSDAQETVTTERSVTVSGTIPCRPHYLSGIKDNWFFQLGAGINTPFFESYLPDGSQQRHITAGYNLAFGKWMSPFVGWRMSFLGGPLHWDNQTFSKAKYVNANLDLMWDMFNSFWGVNSGRRFSIVPFVGLGGTYAWDIKSQGANITGRDGKIKSDSWTLPVSAGLQLRFRLCRYVDFFAEGRAQFYGDNFNNCAYGRPVDINVSAMGGFIFNIGGSGFKSYDPCEYLSYIDNLNGQINDLRGTLSTTAAALAAAEAQLPCPEVSETVVTGIDVQPTPLMATVRFTLNSSKITDQEKVSVYNIAQWMKDNPDQSVVIEGYADKNTGSSAYNMALSERRAQRVYDLLVNEYDIDPDRLAIQAEGSDVQPYDVNSWNRIVIFSVAE